MNETIKPKTIAELKVLADAIPELGCGGGAVRKELILAASAVKNKRTIVDIAPYLGSTTAYAALGVNISGNMVDIHSIDLWEADDDYRKKAFKYHNMKLKPTEDLKRRWKYNIKEFITPKCRIIGAKGDVKKVKLDMRFPIGLYIDDIDVGKKYFKKAMKKYSKHFIPGETILFLMDWGFYERDEGIMKYQKKFMDANTDAFTFLMRPSKSYCGIFLYNGGKIKYRIKEDK